MSPQFRSFLKFRSFLMAEWFRLGRATEARVRVLLDSRSILDFPNLNQDLKISKIFIKRFNNLITIYVDDK